MALKDKLTEASIVEEARQRADLHDLGDDHFLEPLRMLLEGLRSADLGSSRTVLVVRGALVKLVRNRIRIHDAVTRDPAVKERPVRPPMVITGVPRTGTTLLHNLLSQDPEARPLRFFESMTPVRRQGTDEAGQIAHARKLVRLTKKFSPDMARAHALGAEAPEECLGLLQNTFVTPFMTPFLPAPQPRYRAWLEALGPGPRDRSYEEYLLQLRILQEDDTRRWTLKCPCHLFGLASLLRVVPGAMVVQTHRDLRQSIPSLCSLQAAVTGLTGAAPSPAEQGRTTTQLVADLVRWASAARTPENDRRILDVRFDELVADPVGTVERIHDHWDLPVSDAFRDGMRAWLEANPRHKHGRHAYALEDYDLDGDAIVQRFESYYRRFLPDLLD